MKKELIISYHEIDNIKELSPIHIELIEQAQKTLKNAYAIYSNFYVGCSILLENGEVFTGNNQENLAFPSGMCAERTALFYASAQYPDSPVRTIAIAASSENINPLEIITPCGACRQVMVEYETKFNKPIEIILTSPKGKIWVIGSAKSLIPFTFSTELKNKK
ncbi:MAG: cytidine deaminase [Bacteroidia bacterium]|nr:cytidine deaminase [Bacteroidia bacterium]